MKLVVRHVTTFRYARPVAGGRMEVRLTPWSGPGQRLIDRQLDLAGSSVFNLVRDRFGNSVDMLQIEDGQQELRLVLRAEVETSGRNAAICPSGGGNPDPSFKSATPATTPGSAINRIVQEFAGENPDDPKTMHQLSSHIRSVVAYRTGCTDTNTLAEDAALRKEGVCQDHAHIFIAAARQLGLAARYVSGYLRLKDQVEQTAMHAWSEVHLRNLGWVGFDVSNGISPDECYIGVAVGRDYFDAAPTTGFLYGGGDEEMTVAIDVI